MGDDDLRAAVAAWFAAIDALAESRRQGVLSAGRTPALDRLPDLARVATAAPPSPLRDAVLALDEAHEDLRLLAAGGASLSAGMRAAAADRAARRFAELAERLEPEPEASVDP